MICDKISYESPNDPLIHEHKRSISLRNGDRLCAYKCPNCPFWHLMNPVKHNRKHASKQIKKKEKYKFDYRKFIHPKP